MSLQLVLPSFALPWVWVSKHPSSYTSELTQNLIVVNYKSRIDNDLTFTTLIQATRNPELYESDPEVPTRLDRVGFVQRWNRKQLSRRLYYDTGFSADTMPGGEPVQRGVFRWK